MIIFEELQKTTRGEKGSFDNKVLTLATSREIIWR